MRQICQNLLRKTMAQKGMFATGDDKFDVYIDNIY